MRLERFTEKAQDAFQAAQEIMQEQHHTQLDVEHVFLAMLRQRDGLAARALARLNVDPETISQRVERDARDEAYLSLLGKSQTYHGRQRVGDLMARVTNDTQQASQLITPGFNFVIESLLSLLVPLLVIGLFASVIVAVQRRTSGIE